ncbi:MAG: T9SS C-terminal target domain-containing protein [Bacteroidetes bacterium]|nr:MAG: T9SS C-terminal target domain-containing protein [Bacteroidota bacterium]
MKNTLRFIFGLMALMVWPNAMPQSFYDGPQVMSFGADRAYDDSERREIPSAILVWDQSVVRSAEDRYFVSSSWPQGFTSMVVLWSAIHDEADAADFTLQYRAQKQDGTWTPFRRSSGEYHPSESPRAIYAGELLMLSDGETFKAFEAEIIVPHGQEIIKIEVDLIDISVTYSDDPFALPAEKLVVESLSSLEFPEIVRRSSWCLTNACLNPTYTINYIEATHTLIHYGAVPNDYSDGAAVVRSYWDYHVNTLGWFDIGYNYLVDKFGNLFEGRHNPNLPLLDVRAAHAGPSNAVSIGVNFLGNTNAPALYPTEVQLGKNVELLAWWYDYKEFDPTSIADIILQDPSGEIQPRYRISGHMDVGATACPGTVLHGMLPAMRQQVLDNLPSPDVFSVGNESVEGEEGNYPTFRAAVTALNNQETFDNDILLLITSDLEEDCITSGIGLAVDPSPFTITIKPAPGKTPTISFNYPGDVNAGPSGAFIIGITHENNIAWTDAKPTRNIIFDGSNTEDGTTRDLTFTNTTGTHRNGMPFLLIGDVADIVVKNLNIYHQATNQPSPTQVGFNGAFAMRVNHNAETDNAPRNIIIDNNHISVDFPGVSPGYNGVNVFRSNAGTVGYIENTSFINNLIEGKANGFFLAWAGDSIEISGNEIRVNQDIGTGILAQAALQFPLGLADANILVAGNYFSKIANIGDAPSVNMAAIDIVAGGNYLIANNMISGFDITAETGHNGFLRGVRVNNVAANLMFVYNSMLLNELENVSGTTQMVMRGFDLVSGNVIMKNNIIASTENGFAFNLLHMPELPDIAEHNLYYLDPEGTANLGFHNNISYTDLEAWQTATGKEQNTLFADPQFVSDTDLMILVTSPAKEAGTPIAEVDVDFFGTPRDAENPCIGAHENLDEIPVYNVIFNITDEDGIQIDNAVITLDGTTNPAGEYIFSDLQAGEYDYEIMAEGFFSVSGTVEVVDQNVNLDIELTAIPQVEFTVTFLVANQDGYHITDAVITLNGVTNPAGVYLFEDLEAGEYDFLVTAPGYFDYPGTVEVEDKDVLVVVIMIVDNTFVGETEGGPAYRLFPNPAGSELNIYSETTIRAIAVFDLSGRAIDTMDQINSNQLKLNVSQYKKGIYLISIYSNQGVTTLRFQVQ